MKLINKGFKMGDWRIGDIVDFDWGGHRFEIIGFDEDAYRSGADCYIFLAGINDPTPRYITSLTHIEKNSLDKRGGWYPANDLILLEEYKENKTYKKTIKGDDGNMSMKKLMGNLKDKFKFGENTDIKMTFRGTLAIPDGDDYISYENGCLMNNHGLILDFDCCFEMPAMINQLKSGDIVRIKDTYYFVGDKGSLIRATGTKKQTVEMKDIIFGDIGNMVTKVFSIFNMSGDNNMFSGNNMLPMMMLMGKDEDNDMASMLMMSQMMGGNGANIQNNMLPLMLMGKDGNMKDMAIMMMFMNGGMSMMQQTKIEEAE